MARARRRTGRSSQKTPEATVDGESSALALKSEASDARPSRQDEDTCPACTNNNESQDWGTVDKESWVRCDACKTWFHWRCAGDGSDLDAVDKWFCKPCVTKDPSRVITMKPPARKSSRKRTQRDYAGLHSGLESDPSRWLRMLEGKEIKADPFKRMKGSEVGIEWLETDETAMLEPVIIESTEGLGMKMPPKDFTVNDVAELVGEDTPVEVIDVATQSNLPGWTLGKWAEYYDLEPSAREKIRNVISLEISGTQLANQVLPPRLVREVDWVEKFWPSTRKGRGHAYPKVQLYCLMGVAGAWTDWHVDFAGSSVYYHVLHGKKVFYFIRPTPANLAAYEKWSGTEIQNVAWLGDMADEVYKVEVEEGNTMIIPTGWIHAVHTPVDTLVFGGNFLHSYNVAAQLKVREIEITTHVPKKFRFPLFVRLCWYVAEKYLRDLKAKEEFSTRVLQSIEALADFLVSEARAIERGTEQAKREAKEHVPLDRVKDAPALARELRWRVRLVAGYESDDDGGTRRKAKTGSEPTLNGIGNKRKRANEDDVSGLFRNFKPKTWEQVASIPVETESRVVKARKPPPDDTDWTVGWREWKEELEDAEDGQQAEMERRREVIVKVRKTNFGVERQRVERIWEDWVWHEDPPAPPPPPSEAIAMDVDSTPQVNGKEEDPKMAVEDSSPIPG